MNALLRGSGQCCVALLLLGVCRAVGAADAPAAAAPVSEDEPAAAAAVEAASGPLAVPAEAGPPSVPILRGPSRRPLVPSWREDRPVPELEAPRSDLESFYETFLKDRLSLGARYSSFSFDEARRPEDETRTLTFLGYVNELEFEEDSSVTLVVGYELCPYLAMEYSHDEEVRARTWNFNTGRSDGVLKMSGPMYGLTLRLPIRRWFCPYLGIGYAPWKAEFQHEAWWTLGYSSEESYVEQGSLDTARHSYRRIIEVEDDSASFLYFGISMQLHRYVALDVSMREIELTSKAAFYQEFAGARELSREGEFPLSFTTYSVALKAVF